MGAIAEAIVAFAQPLLDETDGSPVQMQSALTLAQVCWNLALLPDEDRDDSLAEMRPTLKMDDEEFETFRRSVLIPMIQRHHAMFPDLSRLRPTGSSRRVSPPPLPPSTSRTEKYRGTGRNAPCPCNSGKKYKRCCGR